MGDDYVYMAKLAEQAERYDEMVEYMKTVASSTNQDLSLEERNLLSVAYKNVVGARRASLRIIGSIESKENEKGAMDKAAIVGGYKTKVSRSGTPPLRPDWAPPAFSMRPDHDPPPPPPPHSRTAYTPSTLPPPFFSPRAFFSSCGARACIDRWRTS